jgi:hypothetical protein
VQAVFRDDYTRPGEHRQSRREPVLPPVLEAFRLPIWPCDTGQVKAVSNGSEETPRLDAVGVACWAQWITGAQLSRSGPEQTEDPWYRSAHAVEEPPACSEVRTFRLDSPTVTSATLPSGQRSVFLFHSGRADPCRRGCFFDLGTLAIQAVYLRGRQHLAVGGKILGAVSDVAVMLMKQCLWANLASCPAHPLNSTIRTPTLSDRRE